MQIEDLYHETQAQKMAPEDRLARYDLEYEMAVAEDETTMPAHTTDKTDEPVQH